MSIGQTGTKQESPGGFRTMLNDPNMAGLLGQVGNLQNALQGQYAGFMAPGAYGNYMTSLAGGPFGQIGSQLASGMQGQIFGEAQRQAQQNLLATNAGFGGLNAGFSGAADLARYNAVYDPFAQGATQLGMAGLQGQFGLMGGAGQMYGQQLGAAAGLYGQGIQPWTGIDLSVYEAPVYGEESTQVSLL
jgi:hypothetical protein